MRTRLGLITGATVLISIGVFFAVEGTGKAGQYASIASFFLAVPVAVAAVVALLEARSAQRTAETAKENQTPRPDQVRVNNISDCDTVVTGNGARTTVTYHSGLQAGRARTKKQKSL